MRMKCVVCLRIIERNKKMKLTKTKKKDQLIVTGLISLISEVKRILPAELSSLTLI